MEEQKKSARALRDTVVYYLRDEFGIVYIGVTKNIRRRLNEHNRDGKRFIEVKISSKMSRKQALIEETRAIHNYQNRNIINEGPKYNVAKVKAQKSYFFEITSLGEPKSKAPTFDEIFYGTSKPKFSSLFQEGNKSYSIDEILGLPSAKKNQKLFFNDPFSGQSRTKINNLLGISSRSARKKKIHSDSFLGDSTALNDALFGAPPRKKSRKKTRSDSFLGDSTALNDALFGAPPRKGRRNNFLFL